MQIPVRLKERSYSIYVTEGYHGLVQALKRLGLQQPIWILSHQRLLRLYGKELVQALSQINPKVYTLCIPEGEASKNLEQLQRVLRQIARHNALYTPLIVAFGGGVVGDLAGFAAASYRRGVPYIQVPTTLLAQVDSAIGGKVGVDLPEGKNLVGAYYQPRLVYNNTVAVQSLPLRQRQTGLAEVIKYGVIADAVLFRFLEEHMADCLALKPEAVQEMVGRSCRIKARVVSQDEREAKGLRLHLNYGHTLGHALEAATGYTRWTHGEAIAVGMAAVTWMAVQLGACSQKTYARIERLLQAAGLPVVAPGINPRTLVQALSRDKKFVSGKQRWVLPSRIGHVFVSEAVPTELVHAALQRFCPASRRLSR